MEKKKELQKQIDESLSKLRTLRDEIRVQAHLFGMELKQAWAALEPRVLKAEEAALEVTEVSAAALGGAIQALIEFLKTTKKKI